jgi:hypothetical protein
MVVLAMKGRLFHVQVLMIHPIELPRGGIWR